MTSASTSTDMKHLLQYLEFSVDARKRLGIKKPKGFHYFCLEDFVLQHGRPFPELSPNAERYVRRPMKGCFDNTFKMVSRSRGKLRYVEGFASGVLPVHHAWAIDEHDRVIDRTWYEAGSAYFGIIVPIEYVRSIRTLDNVCVLDRWQGGYPLFREPFVGF